MSEFYDRRRSYLLQRQLRSLVIEWAHLLDRGPLDRIPGLFTEAGRYTLVGSWDIQGRENLRERYRVRSAQTRIGRHVCSNQRIVFINEKQATQTAIFTVYRYQPPAPNHTIPSAIMDVTTQFELVEPGQWLISEHHLVPVFAESQLLPGSSSPGDKIR